MVTVLIAAVVIGAIAFVAYPLFKHSDELDVAFVGVIDPVWEHLVTQRDAMYSAIKDLELDHTMGKLSDADYRILRAKYEAKAVAILQELDNLNAAAQASGRVPAIDDTIEREVAMLRRVPANGTHKCPRCSTPHQPGDVFCAKCGTALKGTRCPACGRRAAPGDKFCGKCGKSMD